MPFTGAANILQTMDITGAMWQQKVHLTQGIKL